MQQYQQKFYLAKPSSAVAHKILTRRCNTIGAGRVEDATSVVSGLAGIAFAITILLVVFKPNVIVVSIAIVSALIGVAGLVVKSAYSLKTKFTELLKSGDIVQIHLDLHDRWIAVLYQADIPEAYAHERLTDQDFRQLAMLSGQYEASLINRQYDKDYVQPSLDAITQRLRDTLKLDHEASREVLASYHPNYLFGSPLAN